MKLFNLYIVGSKCEPGWELFQMSCYKIPEDLKNWESAENYCVQEGGHLASIHSKEENDFLFRLEALSPISSPVSIIGGKVKPDQTFFWSDGTEFDYSNWQPGQPQGPYGTQVCIVLLPGREVADGTWIVDRCDNPFKYICKKPFEGN